MEAGKRVFEACCPCVDQFCKDGSILCGICLGATHWCGCYYVFFLTFVSLIWNFMCYVFCRFCSLHSVMYISGMWAWYLLPLLRSALLTSCSAFCLALFVFITFLSHWPTTRSSAWLRRRSHACDSTGQTGVGIDRQSCWNVNSKYFLSAVSLFCAPYQVVMDR